MLELGSIDLVARFVAEGYGAGLIPLVPGAELPADLLVLPLPGFSEVGFHVFTLGKRSTLADLFIEEAENVIRGWSRSN